MEGWIFLHRKLNDTAFKNKPLVVALFVDLLTNANHAQHKFIFNKKEMIVEAGTLVTGLHSLHKRTGISYQSLRTALVTLKSTSTITIQSNNQFSVITICNWKSYQQLTSKLTNDQQATNKRPTTNNNDKNEIINISKDISYGDPDINLLIAYMKEGLGLPALDESVRVNRMYAQHCLKKFGSVDKVKLLIDATSTNKFWSTKVTSFKTLYYKAVQIISSNRDQKFGVTKL